jgi:hypothetical protein
MEARHLRGIQRRSTAAPGLLWPFAPMHHATYLPAAARRATRCTGPWPPVTVFLMFLAIGFGATAFGKRFRLYSIVTIAVPSPFEIPTSRFGYLESTRFSRNGPDTHIEVPFVSGHAVCAKDDAFPSGNPLASRRR